MERDAISVLPWRLSGRRWHVVGAVGHVRREVARLLELTEDEAAWTNERVGRLRRAHVVSKCFALLHLVYRTFVCSPPNRCHSPYSRRRSARRPSTALVLLERRSRCCSTVVAPAARWSQGSRIPARLTCTSFVFV